MSQSMNTTAGPIGDIAPPSNNRWWAIAAGIGLAAVLGYGAALIATDHLPGADHPVTAPVAAVATPQVENGAVRSSAVHPLAEQPDIASQSAVGTSGAVAQSNAGADDLATRSAAGSSGVVAHSALDPFEAQSASPQALAAVGAIDLSPQEISALRGEAMVEYFASQAAVGQLSSPSVVSEYLGRSRELSPQQIEQLRGEAMAEYFAAQSPRSAVAQSSAGADAFATRLTDSEAIRYAGAGDLATQSSVVGASEIVEQSILDALAERSVAASSSAVGAGEIVEQSILDALEERSGAVSSAAVTGTLWGTEFSDPSELYPAVAGTSGAVAQSALDPFEERVGSPGVQAATGTASASPEEITRSPSDSAVGYFDGRWHGVGDPTESAESLSQPSVAYFDGQWHIDEASNKYPTSEFR